MIHGRVSAEIARAFELKAHPGPSAQNFGLFLGKEAQPHHPWNVRCCEIFLIDYFANQHPSQVAYDKAQKNFYDRVKAVNSKFRLTQADKAVQLRESQENRESTHRYQVRAATFYDEHI